MREREESRMISGFLVWEGGGGLPSPEIRKIGGEADTSEKMVNSVLVI